MDDLSVAFFRTYANLPLGARTEIVAVVDNEPITWNVAYLEIKAASTKANHILHELKALELI
ncbi:MAG TPA: hypothetical protein VFT53_06005 [Candidatus Saccharimonadales bacterium]|nr:hypothetical protein [Candidatus Saccharimonadales bacterium]